MNCYQELIIVGLRVYKILKISQVLSHAAVTQGLDVKTAEFTSEPLMKTEIVHIRIGREICSPLALEKKVDILVCFEPLRAVGLAIKYLSTQGMIIMNTHSLLPFIHFSKEIIPLFEQLAEKIVKLDIIKIAEEAGDVYKNNFVMLGILDGLNVLPISSTNIRRAVEEIVDTHDIKVSLKAMELGSKTVSFPKL